MDIPQKGTLDYSAWNVLHNALRVHEGEHVLIITDNSALAVGDAFFWQTASLANTRLHYFNLDTFERPLRHLPDSIRAAIPRITASVYVASTLPGEMDFRSPLLDAIDEQGVRHAHGIGMTEEIALNCLQVDIAALEQRCNEFIERIRPAAHLHLTSPAGTDLVIELDPAIKWLHDLVWQPKLWNNIPFAECYTGLRNSNGVVVVDGILGDGFDVKYGLLNETPITWRVNDNYVVAVSCDKNKSLERDFRTYLRQHPHAHRLGELGKGMLAVPTFFGRIAADEKKDDTMHLAVGDGYPDRVGGPDFGQPNHCDGVIKSPTLTLDNGDVIVKDGVYRPRL